MILTEKQQRLLIEIYNNKFKITKREQHVYSSHTFYGAMMVLKDLKLIKSKSNNGSRGFAPKTYILTHRGIAFTNILLGKGWL